MGLLIQKDLVMISSAAPNYITACILSGVTAVFTMLSAWTPDKRKSFFFQIAQCLAYAAASWFYGVYPAVISMLVCAVRNYLVGAEKYTARSAIILTTLAAVIGFATNTSGFMGLLPVIATMEYGIFLWMFRSPAGAKANIIANLSLWVIYDFMIRDFINGTVDSVSCAFAVISMVRILRGTAAADTLE